MNMQTRLVKICGMKYPGNIREILQLKPDMIGFNFYSLSPRYVTYSLLQEMINEIPADIQKVGVFVNESPENIIKISQLLQLDKVQLHGNESPSFCKELTIQNISIIKAFGIREYFDFSRLEEFAEHCDMFLFDYSTKKYGGSGNSFNWNLLNNYRLDIPFLLAGGIGGHNIEEAMALSFPALSGFDLNSSLELSPGHKSREITEKIIQKIRQYE
jgi:phosphoribosylanthranilate isomerase